MLNATDKKEIQDIFAKEAGSIISQEIRALLPNILSQNGVMTLSGKNQRSRTQKSTTDHTTDAGTDHTADHVTDHTADQEAPYALGTIETLPKGSTDVKLQFMYQYMYLNFKFVNQRCADINTTMNQRFEDMHKAMNRHAEDTNKRFEDMNKAMNRHSEDMNKAMNRHSEDMNKRFEDMHTTMNQRFEDMNKRFTSLQWFIGIIVGLGTAALAALIALLRFPIQ